MAYNRKNHLSKVIEVQNIVKEHKKFGATQVFIFKMYIEKQFHISQSTFNRWMSTPAHMDLRKIEKNGNKN